MQISAEALGHLDVGAGGELVFDTRRVKMGTNSQKYSMRHKILSLKRYGQKFSKAFSEGGTNSQKYSLNTHTRSHTNTHTHTHTHKHTHIGTNSQNDSVKLIKFVNLLWN